MDREEIIRMARNEWEQVKTTEWARVDKDFNVTYLDMDLCAKGPQNVYTALAIAIWNKAVQEEREACAKVCEAADKSTHPADLADAIRARGQA